MCFARQRGSAPAKFQHNTLVVVFVYNLTNTVPCKFKTMIRAASLFLCLFTLSATHSPTHSPREVLKLRFIRHTELWNWGVVFVYLCANLTTGKFPPWRRERNPELHISRFTDNWLSNFSLFIHISQYPGNISHFPTGIKTKTIYNTRPLHLEYSEKRSLKALTSSNCAYSLIAIGTAVMMQGL
jgi:hypothetical protein